MDIILLWNMVVLSGRSKNLINEMIYLIEHKFENVNGSYLFLSPTPTPEIFVSGNSTVIASGEESWGIEEIIKFEAIWKRIYENLGFFRGPSMDYRGGVVFTSNKKFLEGNFLQPGVMEGIEQKLRECPGYLELFLPWMSRKMCVRLYHSIWK